MLQTLEFQPVESQPSGLYGSVNQERIAFPLKHTEVQAKVVGNISRVEVTQSFENPFTTPLEAIYVFPLPDEAAVDEMLIRIGDRTIQGSIKQRQEAQQIYEQAKQQGRTAGLLEQERDNIFTQSLANIQPGEQIQVIIRYSDSLKFEGGNYEFVFPMVVGPRYIPGTTIEDVAGSGSAAAPMTRNQDTDLVPDASQLNAPILPPGTRSRHDINVTIEINAGVEIRHLASPSHQIQVARAGQTARVNLAGGDTIPNKDLILRYQVSGDRTQSTVLTQTDDRGGHFAVYLIPALQYRSDQLVAKDVVFLIDTSGSQAGAPLMQCQELMRRFIAGLHPADTFSIIDFSDTTQQLSPVPLTNTPENRSRAIRYIDQLNAGGGTNMLRGVQAILNFPVTDPGRLRSIVLLTDGYIGNEDQILTEVQRHLKPGNRLHSFGAGSSVNRFLLNRVAELGRGISRIIRHDEPIDAVVEKFFQQINNPVLANLQLQWEGVGEPPEIYPTVLPDLFAEQPLVLFGRKPDRQAGKLHLTGVAASGLLYQQTFALSFEAGNPAIAQLWGRARIKSLMNQMVSGETKSGVDAVTEVALTYQLLSLYTAFVAVGDDVRVNPTQSVSVQVPVEMPDGIRYEGIFGGTNRVERSSAPALARCAANVQFPAWADVAEVEEMQYTRSFSPEEILEQTIIDIDEELVQLRQAVARASELDALKSQPSYNDRLQIVGATGLDASAIVLLTQHLQALQLPTGYMGDLVFELRVSKERVRQVVFDEQASSLQEATVIEAIRRSLLTWQPPQSTASTVLLTLRIPLPPRV